MFTQKYAKTLTDRTFEAETQSTFYETPKYWRMQQITSKLSNSQNDSEKEVQFQTEAFNQRIQVLEGKLGKLVLLEDSKLSALNDQLINAQESLSNEALALDVINEKKRKEIELSENNFAISITDEKHERKVHEMKTSKTAEEKFFGIKIDVSKERKLREETEEDRILEYGEELDNLQRTIYNEERIRDEKLENIIKTISDNLHTCFDALTAEKKNRKEEHSLYERFIGELKTKVENQISQDKREREAFEENLVRLLEATCQNLEAAKK